ncbi:hypothetical protein NLU13_6961 [Sarocladium strictum]|uniref:Uncharacterized protein n=1 Tax=Sarocladium strictum TaxID=5046 RepID=A0AA39GF25_SARSR|nr:hypothetical protein NLU13_6961 [Sarocladium strictum]
MINQAEAYARDDSVMELLDPRQIRKFKLQVRRGQQQLLELSRRFKDLVDLNRAMLFMGAAFETQTVGWTAGGLVLAGGAILPLGEFMKFVPVNDAGDQEDFPDQGTTVVPLPTETSSGCPPRASDDFPTDCADGDCQGQNAEKCTVGPEKGCPCKPYGRGIVDDYDVEFGNQQQELFKRLLADTPMDCSFGTLGEYADGKAIMEPSAWCVCTTASTTAYYPTRTETGDGACAYTSLPKETISPQQNPPPATTTEPPNPCDTQTVEVPGRCGVPACQYVLAADKGVAALCGEEDYCFCDGVAVTLLTSVHDGSTSLGCGYETLPTKDACPTKTVDPPKATSPPKINRPGPMEHCLKDSYCTKFVCNEDGRHPSCNYDAEPGAAYCRC